MVYLIGIAAAVLLGTGYVLQQRVAVTMPLSEILHWRLLLDVMHRKMWWLGILAMVLGEVLAGLALQFASLDVVEPLLSANLLFALALAAVLARHRPRMTEIGGALLLSASLGLFLAVGDPESASHAAGREGLGLLAVACVGGLALLIMIIGKTRKLVGEAIWLATGAGLLFGLQDAATRAALLQYDRHGFVALFDHIWIYVVIGAAVVGILLAQSAFKAARLDYSLPPITAAEPIAGIALGIGVLGDRISLTIPSLAIEAVCLAALVAGVALIGRSPSLANCAADESSEPAPATERVSESPLTVEQPVTAVPAPARGT